MAADSTRPVRIAGELLCQYVGIASLTACTGASGSVSDRRHAVSMFAANCGDDRVDCIIGDWMSEANMSRET